MNKEFLFEVLVPNKRKIYDLHLLVQKYTIVMKAFYLKSGWYKTCKQIKYNNHLQKLVKLLLNQSYCYGYGYSSTRFNYYYNRLIQMINTQIFMFNKELEAIEQYQ